MRGIFLTGILVLLLSGSPETASGSPFDGQPLPAPQLTQPADQSKLPAVGPANLRWTASPAATQFHLRVTPFQGDGPGINVIGNAISAYDIAAPVLGRGPYILLPGMTYSWQVRVTDSPTAAGEGDPSWGAWSPLWTFRTPAPSTALISPVTEPYDRQTITGKSAALRWSDAAPDIFYYEVQVSQDSQFRTGPDAVAPVWHNLVHAGVGPSKRAWATPELSANATYHWRVRPRVQGDGTPVAWSPSHWFFTEQSPPAVVNVRVFSIAEEGYVEGWYGIAGEVINPGSTDLRSPTFKVSFYLDDGSYAGGDSCSAIMQIVKPGAAVPFITYAKPTAGWTRYEVVAQGSVRYSDRTSAFDLAVVQNTGTYQDARGRVHFTGEVANGTSQTLSADVVAVLYDEAGLVLHAERVFGGELGGGEARSFDRAFTEPRGTKEFSRLEFKSLGWVKS